MNKAELIAAVAAAAEISKKDAETAVTATLDTITTALKEGDKVQLVGFGSFEVKSRAASGSSSQLRAPEMSHCQPSIYSTTGFASCCRTGNGNSSVCSPLSS